VAARHRKWCAYQYQSRVRVHRTYYIVDQLRTVLVQSYDQLQSSVQYPGYFSTTVDSTSTKILLVVLPNRDTQYHHCSSSKEFVSILGDCFFVCVRSR
jgi:hypothetical protein